jgi:hypothetical protein
MGAASLKHKISWEYELEMPTIMELRIKAYKTHCNCATPHTKYGSFNSKASNPMEI